MKRAGDATPVMLISDRADVQREAEACGAIRGFGKSRLGDPEIVRMIQEALGA